MPPDKHLVLDPDVHERLKSRKRARGATLRELGNTILRAALDRPELSDAIAEKLIAAGKLSEVEYRQARRDVLREPESLHHSVADHLQPTTRGTLVAGSWEIEPIIQDLDVEYRIFDARARDGDQRPLQLHCHERSDEFAIVIRGRLLVALEEDQWLLEEGDSRKIPQGRVHSMTPMTSDTQVLVVCVPPDPNIDAVKRYADGQGLAR